MAPLQTISLWTGLTIAVGNQRSAKTN